MLQRQINVNYFLDALLVTAVFLAVTAAYIIVLSCRIMGLTYLNVFELGPIEMIRYV